YTLPRGSVTVSAEATADHVRVQVVDTGIGIPERSLPKVFDRFYRVKDKRTRDESGTGLGLAIVKNIIDAHLGTVEVASEEEKGTTVTVSLPRRWQAEIGTGPAGEA
ncbi:MAG: PAS domain-containing sensor histidine kinase, partial [Armatimonadetes bacterium CG17_big_fil_post_rev_8_21_14_2_50_66_6]